MRAATSGRCATASTPAPQRGRERGVGSELREVRIAHTVGLSVLVHQEADWKLVEDDHHDRCLCTELEERYVRLAGKRELGDGRDEEEVAEEENRC